MKLWKVLLPFSLLLVVAGLVMSACGGEEEEIGTVEVLAVWVDPEDANFKAVVEQWEKDTGGKMDYTGTRDLPAILTTRIGAGNPPDVAILPNPGQMIEFARDGKLVPLDSFLDTGKIKKEYSQAWIDLGTVDGKLYGIFYNASTKGTVWYNPKVFEKNGWQVPKTWDELLALSDQILASGLAPWSIALESGEASGWPGTDWIQQILLTESGPEVFDQWVAHAIPWTDPRIKSAWERFGAIALKEGYVPGGKNFILATNFVPGSYLPFEDPPKAAMYFLGSFVQGFISEQFPDLVAGEDYSFFTVPPIDPQYAGAVTGGANVIVAFNDNPTTRSFIKYLATAEAQQIWVEKGGFIGTNKKISTDAYPDALAAKAAEQLANAPIFRFDPDDLFPSALQTAYWKGVLDYLNDPSQLDSILQRLEEVAQEAYGS